MKAIIQTGFKGIDSVLIYDVEASKLMPTAVEVRTSVVPLIRYDLLKLNGYIPTTVPSVMGYGAVGTITKVGLLRSSNLLGKRVIVISPSGTFKEKIVSNFPPLVIPIPDNVNDEDAVTLIGGGDIAYILFKLLKKASIEQIVIYGANSVSGLILMQLLTQFTNKRIVPIVTKESRSYLNQKVIDYDIRTSRYQNTSSLVIDMAGKNVNAALSNHIKNQDIVYSIAQDDLDGVNFINNPPLPSDYHELLQMVSRKELFIPVDRTFPSLSVTDALAYLSTNHSRGRVCLSFENNNSI